MTKKRFCADCKCELDGIYVVRLTPNTCKLVCSKCLDFRNNQTKLFNL